MSTLEASWQHTTAISILMFNPGLMQGHAWAPGRLRGHQALQGHQTALCLKHTPVSLLVPYGSHLTGSEGKTLAKHVKSLQLLQWDHIEGLGA